jgi:hypothetical protein
VRSGGNRKTEARSRPPSAEGVAELGRKYLVFLSAKGLVTCDRTRIGRGGEEIIGDRTSHLHIQENTLIYKGIFFV